jgi:hypothetical protein
MEFAYDEENDIIYNDPEGYNSTGGTQEEGNSSWETFVFLWNLRVIGQNVPDNISVDLTLASVFGGGPSMTYTINLLTRGDAGFCVTRTEQLRYGGEIDWGLNLNYGFYTGDPFDINKKTLLGPMQSLSGGDGVVGANIAVGYKDKIFGSPSWITIGAGIGLTIGGSYGEGITYPSWNK